MNKVDIGQMTLPELKEYISQIGESAFRAKQIHEWICRGVDFADMSNLPKSLREKLMANCKSGLPKIVTKLVSKIDGTIKYLYEFADGESVESVVMYYKHGTTICISTQVGCRMGCKFCASTIGGRVRNLSASEMLGQIAVAGRDIGERIDGVVMMGIGEPLDNYENSLKFLKLVSADDGLNIGARHISLSTSGLVDKIKELQKENLQITLSISLHAPTDDKRSALMPVNNKWGVDELLSASKEYFVATGRRISIEYTLIAGKNDSESDARLLINVLSKYFSRSDALHVNLIPVNPVSESGFSVSDKQSIQKFRVALEVAGFSATIRRTLGPDINASCGQLRREQNKHMED